MPEPHFLTDGSFTLALIIVQKDKPSARLLDMSLCMFLNPAFEAQVA